MTFSLRPLTVDDIHDTDDTSEILRLNNAASPAVPSAEAPEIRELIRSADHTVGVIDGEDAAALVGFLIGFDPGGGYASENYRWFESRGTDHLYVDRIVVDEAVRGRRIGRLLYEHVFGLARRAGREEVTCEVNVLPPNPRSLAFHLRIGFVEVGRQVTKGGSVEVALLAASVGTSSTDSPG